MKSNCSNTRAIKRIIPLFLLLFIFPGLCAQNEKHRFRFRGKEFLLDDKPLQIVSSEMHPARIPREYWLHRIRMTKAMGCNTIAVYDFWNYHKTTEGRFDFTTGNRDIVRFIRLCRREGMWVLLRPGRPMEAYGQNQGLILYKTRLVGHKSDTLKIWEPHDYALVFLNGRFIDTVERNGGNREVDLPKIEVKDPELEILVEGMGHINFAQFMIDRKGITDRVTLNGMTLMNWQTALFPMNEAFIRVSKPDMSIQIPQDKPCNFFAGHFSLSETGDVYFDMSGYSKGMVYVNGHNLARYWNRGPQQRLYCPASWLKLGNNSIMVFDLLQTQPAVVRGVRKLMAGRI